MCTCGLSALSLMNITADMDHMRLIGNSQEDEACVVATTYSNDLWSFNPLSRRWTLHWSPSLPPCDDHSIPCGREQHSATVLSSGSILIIGGLSSDSEHKLVATNPVFLGDLWEINLGHVASFIVKGSFSFLRSGPGVELVDGNVLYHSSNAVGAGNDFSDGDEICVKDIRAVT
eukprot:10712612-Ditylum_brightwellii.AAC.1